MDYPGATTRRVAGGYGNAERGRDDTLRRCKMGAALRAPPRHEQSVALGGKAQGKTNPRVGGRERSKRRSELERGRGGRPRLLPPSPLPLNNCVHQQAVHSVQGGEHARGPWNRQQLLTCAL